MKKNYCFKNARYLSVLLATIASIFSIIINANTIFHIGLQIWEQVRHDHVSLPHSEKSTKRIEDFSNK